MKSAAYASWVAATPIEARPGGEPDDDWSCHHSKDPRTCVECREEFEDAEHPPCAGCGLRLERHDMATCPDYPNCAEAIWKDFLS